MSETGKCIDSRVLREGIGLILSDDAQSFDVDGRLARFYDEERTGSYKIDSPSKEMVPIRHGDSWKFEYR